MNKSNENFLIVQNAIDMTHNEALRVLARDDDTIKPYALINIEKISSQDEADLIVSHLTNHSNPIREACALRLCDLCPCEFFYDKKILETFCDAICDINPNICRAVIEVIKNDPLLCALMLPLTIDRTKKILNDFKIYEKEFGAFCDNKMKNRKNHAKNKKLFNLYWCLEALSEIMASDTPQIPEIIEIAREGAAFVDYTIREKSAKILNKIPGAPDELLQKLKNDENFYVKNQVCDKICPDSYNRDNL